MAGVQPVMDQAARRVKTGLVSHQELMRTKNASWGRWVGGWPIFPNVDASNNPVATSIAAAMGPFTKGAVDLFALAVSSGSGAGAQVLNGGFPGQGQQPWNNFLGNNQRCFNTLYPEYGGIYIGNLWDMVSGQPAAQTPMSGFYASIIENSVAILQKNQDNEGFIPLIMFPAGVRMSKFASSTVDNALVTTEGFGSMDGRGMKKFRDDERWSKATQMGLQVTPSTALRAFIASLMWEYIPISGSLMAFTAHGVEIRKVRVGAS